MEGVVDTLASIRRISRRDAESLLSTYGCLNNVICAEDYNEFTHLDGIGKQKVDSFAACFKGELLDE